MGVVAAFLFDSSFALQPRVAHINSSICANASASSSFSATNSAAIGCRNAGTATSRWPSSQIPAYADTSPSDVTYSAINKATADLTTIACIKSCTNANANRLICTSLLPRRTYTA